MKNTEVNVNFDEKVFRAIMESVIENYINEWADECLVRELWEFNLRFSDLRYDRNFRNATRIALKQACGLDFEGDDLAYIVNELVKEYLKTFKKEFKKMSTMKN